MLQNFTLFGRSIRVEFGHDRAAKVAEDHRLSIRVGNLAAEITEGILQEMVDDVIGLNTTKSVKIIRHPDTGLSVTYSY